MLFPPEPEQPEQQPTERICRTCGATVAPEYRYCTNCGTPFDTTERRCPNCGAWLGGNYRYCTSCGTDVSSVTGASWTPAAGAYPVRFDVQYPDRLSRLTTFFRLILAIPQLLIIYALATVVSVVTFIAFFAILFTRRYPKGLFDLVVGFNRWIANVYAYTALFRDEYPPFASDPGRYAVLYEVDYPERLSRWLIWIKWFLALGQQLVLGLLSIIGFLFYALSWFAILITGRYPRTFFNFNVGLMRWYLRVSAYTGLMRDEFPPFSKRADAKPGSGKAIALSVVLAFLMLPLYILPFLALTLIDPQTETVFVNYQSLEAGTAEASIRVEGTRVTLSGVEDPFEGVVRVPEGDQDDLRNEAKFGSRFVGFEMTVVNVDSLFTNISVEAFRLEDSSGDKRQALGYSPTSFGGTILDDGERANFFIIFELEQSVIPTSLTYSPGFAAFVPFGERVRFEFR